MLRTGFVNASTSRFSVVCALASAAFLSACSSGSQDNRESMSTLLNELNDKEARTASQNRAIERIHKNTREEIDSLYGETSWTPDNENAYRIALKNTDLVYDESSRTFIRLAREQKEAMEQARLEALSKEAADQKAADAAASAESEPDESAPADTGSQTVAAPGTAPADATAEAADGAADSKDTTEAPSI